MSRQTWNRLFSGSIAAGVLTLALTSVIANGQAPRDAQAKATQPQPPSLLAIFDNKIDSKSAKVGDEVMAKTTRDLKLSDLDIPKGSKLEGRITSVKSAESGSDAMLGVRFDHIEMKNEKILRIQGLIVAIGPAPTNETGLGYNSVLSRGGAGSTPELDPSISEDKFNKDQPELARGSTLEGIALATNFDPDGATLIRGVHRNIKLNSNVIIRVAMFRPQ